MGFILASSVAKSIGENMTNPEIRADVILAQLVPEEVAQTALAKLAVQKSIRLDYHQYKAEHGLGRLDTSYTRSTVMQGALRMGIWRQKR